MTPRAGSKPIRNARNGTESDDLRGQVVLPIAYDGLRSTPVDLVVLSPAEARRLAIELLTSAEIADRIAAEPKS